MKRLPFVLATMLLVSIVRADTTQSFKATGLMPSGHVSYGDPDQVHFARGDFASSYQPDGAALIYAEWSSSYIVDGRVISHCYASGLFPMSAVTVTGRTMRVELTADGNCDEWDLDGGGQSSSYPVEGFRWKGTLTKETSGPAWEIAETNGITTSTRTSRCGEGACSWTTKTTGALTRASADFEGTIGSIAVTPRVDDHNGEWIEHRGQQTLTITTP
jgi:hypothetical protein